MRVRAAEHLQHVMRVVVEGARDERRLGADRDGERPQRRVDRAIRRGLRALAELGGRRILAFGEPIDLVVVQDDLEVDVAPQHVQDVVAANAECVAVARDYPHAQLRPRSLEPGSDRRRAAMDAVEPVRVHVIRQAARAADAGDEDDVLARQAEIGHQLLRLREDRIVAAPRAPAHLLIGHEVLPGEHLYRAVIAICRNHLSAFVYPIISVILRSISLIANGLPDTLLSPTTSTR